MREELAAEYLFQEAPRSRLGRDLYEHGEVRYDLPIEDPWRAFPLWVKHFGLTQAEAQVAARYYCLLKSSFLKGDKLRRIVASAVKQGATWLKALEAHEPEEAEADGVETVRLDPDGVAEGSSRWRDAAHWRAVPLPLKGEEVIPDPQLPLELEGWWDRVREALKGPEREAHRTLRAEIRRMRKRLAWLELIEASLSEGEREVSSLTSRVLREPLQPKKAGAGKVLLAQGVKVSLRAYLNALSRGLRPLWVRILVEATSSHLSHRERVRKLVGKLLDRELHKEAILSQVKLPPLPSPILPGVWGKGRGNRSQKAKGEGWLKEKEELWALARALVRSGKTREASRVLQRMGLSWPRKGWFVIRDYPELGLKIVHPRGVEGALKEERKLFFRLLSLNGEISHRKKQYLWEKWWPYARRILYQLVGAEPPKKTVTPLPG